MTTSNSNKHRKIASKFLKKVQIMQVKPPIQHNLESLAMKALILNALKNKKEAFALCKQVLFKNLANFTCWHVYGILHRSNK